MKKSLLFFSLLIAVGTGCSAPPVINPTTSPDPSQTRSSLTYNNTDYTFSLTLPKEFGRYQTDYQATPADATYKTTLPEGSIYFYFPTSTVFRGATPADIPRLTEFMIVSVIKKTTWSAEASLPECSRTNKMRAPGCLDRWECNRKNPAMDPKCASQDEVLGLNDTTSNYVYVISFDTTAFTSYPPSIKDTILSSFKITSEEKHK